ncbi:hypothetical protein C7A07_02610 [Pseudomonas fragi]|nr:hypothetical protein C7A07_02610 [Pseudomonas fragi]
MGAGLLAIQATRSFRHTVVMRSRASPLPQELGNRENSDSQKRKPRRGGVLQTVSLTSFSLRHPGRILRVRVVALSFLLYVHGK